jgi:PPOX class probable F420-dependent enzyme
MAALNDKSRALIDAPNYAFLATVDEDGAPQVSPVWIDRDGDTILVNTAAGRVKDRNMRREPRVALSIPSGGDFYDKVDIRGHVVDLVEGEEAERHIDKLSKKYTGEDTYANRSADEPRVIFRIEPDRVHG